MDNKERERIIQVLESRARVEIDDSDQNTLRLSRMLSRTKKEDLGVVVITDAGLDLSGLRDGPVEWILRHQEDMGKKPISIKE